MRRLKYIKSYRDRHGKPRYYLRKPGVEPVALLGAYGSKAFVAAYWEAMESAPKREIGAAKTIPGSFSALIVLYYKTPAFTKLREKTKATYRGALDRFRKDHGDKLVKGFKQRHVVAILDSLPGRQENLRKVLRLILNHALERGWIEVHPMAQMRRERKALQGFRPWDDADIAAFEAKWPTGSRERLAMALLLYTGQRRSDVVGMGRQHVRDGKIRVVQQKTGSELWIKLHAALKTELEAVPKTQLTFLQTQYGAPFSIPGFGKWFSERAALAGLPARSAAHGLRKAAARRLAEAGCTPSQIMAVTGHKNLSEVTLYTASADQERLAAEAIEMVEAGTKLTTATGPVRQGRGK